MTKLITTEMLKKAFDRTKLVPKVIIDKNGNKKTRRVVQSYEASI